MKKLVCLILSCTLLLMVTACHSDKRDTLNKENTNTEDKVIKVGLMPDVASIPFVIAKEEGFFRDEEVGVELIVFKSAMDRDSALQAGELDMVSTDVLSVAFSNQGTNPLKIVSKSNSNFILVAYKDSNIKSLEDIKGKSIAISTNTVIEYLTDYTLKKTGLSTNDIEKIAIPKIPTRLEMLNNGKVDLALLPDPLATSAIESGGRYIIGSYELGTNPIVLAFTKDSIEEKFNEIKALYRAYDKAVDYVNNTDKEVFLDIVIRELSFPEGVKDKLQLPKFDKAVQPKEEEIMSVINWLYDKELIDTKMETNKLLLDLFKQE